MKKKIIVFSHWLEIGGAEKALLGLLSHIDKNEYDVDLFLCRHSGELMGDIPNGINLLPEIPQMAAIAKPIKELLKKPKCYGILLSRFWAKFALKYYKYTHNTGEKCSAEFDFVHKYVQPFLPEIQPETEYDLAISFLAPHYITAKKIRAKKKISWIHTDYSTVDINVESERKIWSRFDYIASISDTCTKGFLYRFPSLESKIIRIDNMMSPELVRSQSDVDVSAEICQDENVTTICSVGRFSEAKNYDNVPEICSNILKQGLDIRWYLVGYGGDEGLIKSKIEEFGMQDNVIILGKRENPYPYMKTCDIYAQPSRYEGNSVCVHEAQVLGKPVVITNYATAKDQLKDGFDGVIVPMDNEGCAKGIADLINNKPLREKLSENCLNSDYSNAHGIEVLRKIVEE